MEKHLAARWMAANMLGWSGVVVAFLLASGMILGGAKGIIVLDVVLGMAHWLTVRHHVSYWWIPAFMLGWYCAVYVAVLLAGATNLASLGMIVLGVLGMAQWLVVRPHVSHWWIPVTAVAGAVALSLGVWAVPFPNFLESHAEWKVLYWVVGMGGVAGGAVGSAQWWLLRRRAAHPSLWAPVNAAGWALGCLAGLYVTSWTFDYLGNPGSALVGGAVAVLIFSALSAPALVHMFRAMA
jgi:hypothetical protein